MRSAQLQLPDEAVVSRVDSFLPHFYEVSMCPAVCSSLSSEDWGCCTYFTIAVDHHGLC